MLAIAVGWGPVVCGGTLKAVSPELDKSNTKDISLVIDFIDIFDGPQRLDYPSNPPGGFGRTGTDVFVILLTTSSSLRVASSTPRNEE